MSSGLYNVGAYQISGIPYVSGNTITAGTQHAYFFPNVTSRIKIQVFDNSGSFAHVRVHFAPDTPNNRVISGKHWWQVGTNIAGAPDLFDVNVRCKELYISFDSGSNVNYQIFAELTTISSQDMGRYSGSGIDS